MKRLQLITTGLAQVVIIGGFFTITASTPGYANTTEAAGASAAAKSSTAIRMAEASTEKAKENEKQMTEENAEKSEVSDDFKQRMHEGDVALGVCGARVSALLWFYEASLAQGRDDLKENVESLTESRKVIKKEAERRATVDGVDTSVRVMNQHSEELWDDLNKKASGSTEEFQKTHDELVKGVQECLALFFDAPENADKSDDAKKESEAN